MTEYDFEFGTDIDSDYVDTGDRERADVSVDRDDLESAADEDVWVSDGTLLDTGSGMGSGDYWDDREDEQAVIENDGRSLNETFFYGESASFPEPIADRGPNSTMPRGERLAKYNDGWRINDGYRAPRNRKADRERFIGVLCSQLEVATSLEERIRKVTEDLPLSEMGWYSSDMVILAVLSFVTNEQGRWIRDESAFREIMQAVGMDLSDLRSCRKLVRNKCSAFEDD